MDVSTAVSLSRFTYRNAVQSNGPTQALQQVLGQASNLAAGNTTSLLDQATPADSYTGTLRMISEAPLASASYTMSARAGNGASEVESRLSAVQPNPGVSGSVASAGLDPRAAGALAAYQARSAPNAADAYAKLQAITANAAQAANGITMSLMA